MEDNDLTKIFDDVSMDAVNLASNLIPCESPKLGRQVIDEIAGDSKVVGTVLYFAVNVLTGGALTMMNYVGQAKQLVESIPKKPPEQESTWGVEFRRLCEEKMQLMDQLRNPHLSEKEKERLRRMEEKASKRHDRHIKKLIRRLERKARWGF